MRATAHRLTGLKTEHNNVPNLRKLHASFLSFCHRVIHTRALLKLCMSSAPLSLPLALGIVLSLLAGIYIAYDTQPMAATLSYVPRAVKFLKPVRKSPKWGGWIGKKKT